MPVLASGSGNKDKAYTGGLRKDERAPIGGWMVWEERSRVCDADELEKVAGGGPGFNFVCGIA